MKLTDYAIDNLKEFLTGDNNLTPNQTGSKLVSLFNSVGARDFYKAGLPDGLSRKDTNSSKIL
jgi:hypothetical protein